MNKAILLLFVFATVLTISPVVSAQRYHFTDAGSDFAASDWLPIYGAPSQDGNNVTAGDLTWDNPSFSPKANPGDGRRDQGSAGSFWISPGKPILSSPMISSLPTGQRTEVSTTTAVLLRKGPEGNSSTSGATTKVSLTHSGQGYATDGTDTTAVTEGTMVTVEAAETAGGHRRFTSRNTALCRCSSSYAHSCRRLLLQGQAVRLVPRLLIDPAPVLDILILQSTGPRSAHLSLT